jgi:hypothetical protein
VLEGRGIGRRRSVCGKSACAMRESADARGPLDL